MDWINCNTCCRQPGDESNRVFMLSSCGHLFCDVCLSRGGEAAKTKCMFCSSQCQLIQLSSKIKPDAEMFFLEPAELLKRQHAQINKLLDFQKSHRVRLVSFHKKVMTKYNEMEKKFKTALNRLQELENDNTRLRQLVSSYSGGGGPPPASGEGGDNSRGGGGGFSGPSPGSSLHNSFQNPSGHRSQASGSSRPQSLDGPGRGGGPGVSAMIVSQEQGHSAASAHKAQLEQFAGSQRMMVVQDLNQQHGSIDGNNRCGGGGGSGGYGGYGGGVAGQQSTPSPMMVTSVANTVGVTEEPPGGMGGRYLAPSTPSVSPGMCQQQRVLSHQQQQQQYHQQQQQYHQQQQTGFRGTDSPGHDHQQQQLQHQQQYKLLQHHQQRVVGVEPHHRPREGGQLQHYGSGGGAPVTPSQAMMPPPPYVAGGVTPSESYQRALGPMLSPAAMAGHLQHRSPKVSPHGSSLTSPGRLTLVKTSRGHVVSGPRHVSSMATRHTPGAMLCSGAYASRTPCGPRTPSPRVPASPMEQLSLLEHRQHTPGYGSGGPGQQLLSSGTKAPASSGAFTPRTVRSMLVSPDGAFSVTVPQQQSPNPTRQPLSQTIPYGLSQSSSSLDSNNQCYRGDMTQSSQQRY